MRIHAARRPTFQAQRYRNRGSFGSSNIDLIVAQVDIRGMARIEGQLGEGSDHYPVKFKADWHIDKEAAPRRVPKTLRFVNRLEAILNSPSTEDQQGDVHES